MSTCRDALQRSIWRYEHHGGARRPGGLRARIEAVGITDYFTTAHIVRLSPPPGGAGEGIEFLFPNVELRLDVQTGAVGVNVHLMCAPEDVDWLDQFVGRLDSCIEISPSVRTLKTSRPRRAFGRSPL